MGLAWRLVVRIDVHVVAGSASGVVCGFSRLGIHGLEPVNSTYSTKINI